MTILVNKKTQANLSYENLQELNLANLDKNKYCIFYDLLIVFVRIALLQNRKILDEGQLIIETILIGYLKICCQKKFAFE